MKTRSLRTGLGLTELGLGTAQFGNLFRETTDDEAAGAYAEGIAAGVRYFDTAPHYGLGLSERRLGASLAATGTREEIVLSSKVGKLLVDSPETADRQDDEGFAVPAATRRVWDFSRDGILRSVEASLIRIGTDRLDIAYLHDPDDHWEAASSTGVETLVELRDQGVVGAIGVGMNQSGMLAEFVRRTDVDVVMAAGRLTLLDQSAADELLPLAVSRGVGVVAAAPFNSGLLSSDRVPDAGTFDYAQASDELLQRARSIAEVCARHGVSLPAAALQYPLRFPGVVSVVAGVRTAAQAAATAERSTAAIPDDLWSELSETGLAPRPPIPSTTKDSTR